MSFLVERTPICVANFDSLFKYSDQVGKFVKRQKYKPHKCFLSIII